MEDMAFLSDGVMRRERHALFHTCIPLPCLFNHAPLRDSYDAPYLLAYSQMGAAQRMPSHANVTIGIVFHWA